MPENDGLGVEGSGDHRELASTAPGLEALFVAALEHRAQAEAELSVTIFDREVRELMQIAVWSGEQACHVPVDLQLDRSGAGRAGLKSDHRAVHQQGGGSVGQVRRGEFVHARERCLQVVTGGSAAIERPGLALPGDPLTPSAQRPT